MRLVHSFSLLSAFIAASMLGCGGTDSGTNPSSAGAPENPKEQQVSAYKPVEGEAEEGGASKDAVEQDEAQDIVDTAVAAGKFKTLAAALKAADLVDTLKSDGPFTVFAPTDEAFASLPEGTVENLLLPENKDQLVSILTYHVVPQRVDAAAVSSLSSAQTVNGKEIAIAATADGVQVGGANVLTADVLCSNGIIHIVDAVILPPSDEAPASHPGESLTVEGVGSFKTLFAAIEAAGLNETLEKGAPFTIFAPTDEAFAALPEGTVENLLKPENKDQLVAILTHHVVPGRVASEAVVKLDSATSVNGSELQIKVDDGNVTVGDATVLKTDLPCEVGLIHAINKVLLP